MNEEQRIKLLEEELKILKNEVKAILLDIREQYLNIQNPFNFNLTPNIGTPPSGNPELNNKQLETPQDEYDLGKELKNNAEPMEPISFGKPFSDPTPALEAEAIPPAAPPGALMDLAGAGPSQDETEADDADAEEEPPKKAKNNKDKKKGNTPPVLEAEPEEEEADEDDFEEKLLEKITSAKPNGKKKREIGNLISSGKGDLVVIAGLTQWVDQATFKLGKERTETLLEMAHAMGRIPDNIKDILVRMSRISRHESNGQSPTATDYISLLAQLESLMGGSEIKDNALLSIISMMKESSRG